MMGGPENDEMGPNKVQMTDAGHGVMRQDLSERQQDDEARKAETRQDQLGLGERQEDDKRRPTRPR